MKYLLIRWVINAAALYVAVTLIPGFHFTGTPLELLGVALIFGIVNAVVRPVLELLTCPLVLLTLGLFLLVLNALMLLLTARLSQGFGLGFAIDGFWPAFWGGLLVGLVSVALTIMIGKPRRVAGR